MHGARARVVGGVNLNPKRASVASAILMALVMAAFISLPLGVSAQPDCLINGHVYDAQNNQPIQGAFITFTNNQNSTVSNLNADGSGYYSISLPYAPYTVHVEEPGYDPIDMDVNLDQPSVIQDFRLSPSGSGTCQAEGHVYDAQSSQPISGAHVTLTNQQTNISNDVFTDGSGRYNMNLPYGMYNAHIEAQGYNPSDMVVSLNQPSFTQDFVLQPNGSGGGNVCQLEGFVRGFAASSSSSSGPGTSVSVGELEPIAGVHITFANPQTNITGDTYTDGSGHYGITLPYGSYTVRLEKSGYSTGNEGVDAYQPSATRDFELQVDGSGGGGDGGEGDGIFGGDNPSEGLSSTFANLGTIMVWAFSIVLVCVIIVTIIIAVVIFIVKFIRG